MKTKTEKHTPGPACREQEYGSRCLYCWQVRQAAPEQHRELDRLIRIVETYASNPADCVKRLQGCLPEACAAIAKAQGQEGR